MRPAGEDLSLGFFYEVQEGMTPVQAEQLYHQVYEKDQRSRLRAPVQLFHGGRAALYHPGQGSGCPGTSTDGLLIPLSTPLGIPRPSDVEYHFRRRL